MLDRLPGDEKRRKVNPQARSRAKCSSASSRGKGRPTKETSRWSKEAFADVGRAVGIGHLAAAAQVDTAQDQRPSMLVLEPRSFNVHCPLHSIAWPAALTRFATLYPQKQPAASGADLQGLALAPGRSARKHAGESESRIGPGRFQSREKGDQRSFQGREKPGRGFNQTGDCCQARRRPGGDPAPREW